MCGIAGLVWAPGAEAGRRAEAHAAAMAEALAHRGPDSAGVWADPAAGVALGHRRLAVVDLSAEGQQPMASPSGRFVLCYNGEVYDHADLRRAAEATGHTMWRGTSDTETLAAGFDLWGVTATLERATGMWALAVWDRQNRRLTLSRDRLGEKPLYYGAAGGNGTVLFGSELRSLRQHPAFESGIAREELVHVVRHGYVREGHSIHPGIRQVRPGECLELAPGQTEPCATIRYWNGAEIAATARDRAPFEGTLNEAVDRLETLLDRSVARQMIADVPLGAFLSGGVDSSAVVALMQRHADRPVHTFSIGFEEARYDEAGHARAVAAHLGTDHTEIYLSDADLLAVVPRLADIWDEPFGDSSQIPTYLVSELAGRSVTVALSGDGGDELFGGYDRYAQGARLLEGLARVPLPPRRLAARGIEALPHGLLDAMLAPLRRTPRGKEPNGQWIKRLAEYAASPGADELHARLVAKTRRAEAVVRSAGEPASALSGLAPARGALSDAERMMQLDMITYLPGDILTKVDRASMAVSLECRAPLLDHAIAEFAWSLPPAFKTGPRGARAGGSKRVLRGLLHRLVPPDLVERPKMGFEVPIGLWLRGALRDWAEDLLSADRLRRDDLFDAGQVRALWAEHLSERCNHGAGLWNILMVQAWKERWDK